MKYFLVMMLAANALVAQTRTIPAEIKIEFTVREFGLQFFCHWRRRPGP